MPLAGQLRPRWTRGRTLGLIWIVQAVAIYLVPGALFSFGQQSLSQFFESITEPEYLLSVGILAVIITGAQAAFVLPIREPTPKADPRPGRARLLGIALSIGIISGTLVLYLFLFLDSLGVGFNDGRIGLASWTVPLVTPFAYFELRRRYRLGMPVFASIICAALLAGVLFAAALLGLIGLAQLLSDLTVEGQYWNVALVASPALGWVIFTPLIIAFVRRGNPDAQLARILIGSVIESVAVIPVEVMLRRKSSCYCDSASFWSLALSLSVGTIVLGPAIFLLPVRRYHLRVAEGRCRACGYDMNATPDADRCPECGVGWRV